MTSLPLRILIPVIGLMLAGCDTRSDEDAQLNALDNELSAMAQPRPARDPQLVEALAGQIMVDPGLTQTSNANAVRPPNRPDSDQVPILPPPGDPVDPRTLTTAPKASADCPECRAATGALTLGALAARQTRARCLTGLRYTAGWAARLPAPFALYPGGRLREAAGNDADGCALRIVAFQAGGAVDKVIDYYFTRATAAGYDAEHKRAGAQHVLGGTRGGAAYLIYATARGDGGTDVDLIVKGG